MSRQLKIMFVPFEGTGHVNSGLGLAHILRSRGHHVVFAVRKGLSGLATKYGFDVEVIDNELWTDNQYLELEAKLVNEFDWVSEKTIWWTMKRSLNLFSCAKLGYQFLYNYYNKEITLRQIIAKQNPDIFIMDDHFSYPSLIYSGKPWVWLFSCNPLPFYQDKNMVTPCLGIESNDKRWSARALNMFSDVPKSFMANIYKIAFKQLGYKPNPENRYCSSSPYLNIYGYPMELDYTEGVIPYPNTLRIDMFSTPEMDENKELGTDLKKFIDDSKDKKLILVSMGSHMTADYKTMEKLVEMLSHSEHRFIVSKGFYHNKYELAPNMWGDRSVPQKQIIPLVDAVITHGGNNSLTEAFTYGKPNIVLPVWMDQLDNAQRLHELGFGLRLNLHRLQKKEFLEAIDSVLNDEQMKQRLTTASKRMLSSNSLQTAANYIENLQYLNRN